MNADLLARLNEDRATKRPVALLTNLKSGEQKLFYPADDMEKSDLAQELEEAARRALRDDRSATVETADGSVFVHVHNPPMRL
ncbi:MAG: xanthine dehydrogenase, partial [Alphaproteobacteria bacterium]